MQLWGHINLGETASTSDRLKIRNSMICRCHLVGIKVPLFTFKKIQERDGRIITGQRIGKKLI